MAPIVFCKVNKGYYYQEGEYSINKLNLTEEDLETLVIASSLIKPFDSVGCVKNFPSIIRKILSNTNVSMMKGAELPEMILGSSLPLELAENISLLLQAIRERIVVRIVIKSVGGKERERFFFHPYYLHQSEDVWYLAGIDESDMNELLIELEQIDAVLIAERKFEVVGGEPETL
jgi:predicted DNA-binding transcriptional regulator YafY